MGKPSREELLEALKAAQQMRESGHDPQHVAKALLNLNYRMEYMEKVLEAAEHYLRGQAVHEHTVLQQAVDKARTVNRQTEGADGESLGL